jgi:hypothetical protein
MVFPVKKSPKPTAEGQKFSGFNLYFLVCGLNRQSMATRLDKFNRFPLGAWFIPRKSFNKNLLEA